MSVYEKYKDKLKNSSLEAVHVVEAGDDIIVPLALGEPPSLIKALTHHEGLKGNRLFQMLSLHPVIEVDPEKIKVISMFLNKDERRAFSTNEIDLLPNHFSDLPSILRLATKNRVLMATVSPMDENGYFSLGTNCDYIAPLLDEAKTIILEVNEYMPRTYGTNQVHINDVTSIVEHHAPLVETPEVPVREEDRIIGKSIAGLINDGDTLQIGFGAIPNAIMDYLKDHRDLGIYTEMIPDKVVDLYESGAISNKSNPLALGRTTATFAFGTKRLYDFMHENKDFCMLPVDETNDVHNIAKIDDIVTINATVEVDFLGQCNSETIAGRYYSSTGGQADFGIGARMSKRGKGIICLHSTAKEGTVSKIVPTLAEGSVVTTSKNDVDYVVTEYGVAQLRGKTIRERTEALIGIAHPKFREELRSKAKELGYL
ncbi:acetyl-CoA hydrolase/transferase family protein [Desertibacillus haloalkaliphilus]|uniref:acetyl-CoA hydrolase/transferase family protein n=1 Tax=Desertibacillus haloalkaliphilus TaxID=1328930 RepID=UPI001C263CE7|nr:acetyl-CoA hydrolase/transferase C-terminal domain-containing protein [Desertibacillus haloalkaliphilus]MBU8908958.1 4-hydroxybutyrate CoA-transferase [Desertibacillus haloalkaliphilus]